jgi:hypothetical protein
VIYAAVGAATVLVLRAMRQRWRPGTDDIAVPYGPGVPLEEMVPEKPAPTGVP